MKVLLVHPGVHFSVADVSRGWLRGFNEAGASAYEFRFDTRLDFYERAHIRQGRKWVKSFDPDGVVHMANDSLMSCVFAGWPDLVVVVSGFFVDNSTLDIIRSRGIKTALLLTESPYEDDRQGARAAHVDYVVLNDPTNLTLFQQVNPNTYYQPHAYDPAVHFPRPADKRLASDFCFVGTGYPSRIEFLERVDWSGIDIRLGGHWSACGRQSPLRRRIRHNADECLDNDEAVNWYASTKASANLYRKEATATADGWAMGPREVELAACGTFFLREPRGEGDEVLHMLPRFEDPESFESQLRWYLAHDEERQRVSVQARAAVADRTFVNSAKHLLTRVQE